MIRKFLKLISVNDITFLSDIHKDFFIDKSSKSEHFYIQSFEMDYFKDFIFNLDSNSLYTVIPLISINHDVDRPYLVLSKSILITKYSNYDEFHRYILTKYRNTKEDFGITNVKNLTIIFKVKRVKFDISQIKKKFNLN